MPGAAVDKGGMILVAGGWIYEEERWVPSSKVSIIIEQQIFELDLEVSEQKIPLIGPSVTALGEERFLIFGADLENCGRYSAWWVAPHSETGRPELRWLPINEPSGEQSCNLNQGCKGWRSSAHHSAASIDGEHILITGGLSVLKSSKQGEPLSGLTSSPRALCDGAFLVHVEEWQRAGGRERMQILRTSPLKMGEAERVSVQRAFHRSDPLGDQLIISGGWAQQREHLSLDGSLQLLRFNLDGSLEIMKERLSSPRIGHMGAQLPDGGLIWAGGVQNEEEIVATGAVYMATLEDPDPCAF